ncbi:cytochrome P450 [Aspergillus pseudoustus]|uniref:Cytochrome P450 n=1 Tax=Aspergillus pseudoustus TaxID=1810923 RepID=A0ABR4IVS5_9EURO
MNHPHLLAGAVGVLSHQFHFRRGEHHLQTFRYLLWYLLWFSAIVAATVVTLTSSQSVSASDSTKATTGLLHPLQNIHGRYAAQISGLWSLSRLHRRPAYKVLHDLHARYVPIVRVGPSNVSIMHPKVVTADLWGCSTCTKNSFYDNAHPMRSLHSYRSRADHDQRRRVWSPGFSDTRFRGYESRMRVYRQKLKRKGSRGTIDMSTWSNFYNYDVTSDLAFARSFEILDTRSSYWAIDVLLAGIEPLGWYLPSWAIRCLDTIPSLSKDSHRFVKFTTKAVVERINISLLMGDAMLVIRAGSAHKHRLRLARHIKQVGKLRAELEPLTPDNPSSGEYEYLHSQTATLPHLNGFINETLRLHLSIPTVITRDTPPEGITLNVKGTQTHNPGGVTVFRPQCLIGRSPKAYRPDYIKAREAYGPFSSGAYSCIGKLLALMTIRRTVARLVLTFDISFPEGLAPQCDSLDKARDPPLNGNFEHHCWTSAAGWVKRGSLS